MAGYIGTQAVSVNTTSATISDDLAVGDDLTVTDDATIGGTALVTGVLTTTAATVFNGGFASNANSTMGTDKKLIFRDSAIHISSTADGDLSIAADDEIDISSTLIDVNGNLDVSGTIVTPTFQSTSTGARVDLEATVVDFVIDNNTSSGNRYSILKFNDRNTVNFQMFQNHGDNNVTFRIDGSNGDMFFVGNDDGAGASTIALKLDMSDAGAATFNNGLTLTDGNLKVASGHGINFHNYGTGSGIANNLLDDYERGSFTVGYSGATIGGGGNTGHYIKVGSMVFWTFYSEASNISSASGNAAITGLPFTVYNDVSAYSPINIAHNTYFGGSATVGTQGYHGPNGTTMVFNNPGVTTSSTYVNGNSKYLMVSGTYVTDA